MNDHLMGTDVFSYPDIRISEKKIHPFFCSLRLILKARKLKFDMNDPLTAADDFDHPDIRISKYPHPDFLDI